MRTRWHDEYLKAQPGARYYGSLRTTHHKQLLRSIWDSGNHTKRPPGDRKKDWEHSVLVFFNKLTNKLLLNKEERYSRVPRLSDTRLGLSIGIDENNTFQFLF